MKVVVTGASGNIGSATVRELSAYGANEVLGLARRRPTLDSESEHAGVQWHSADVAGDDLVPILLGAEAAVHLAWKFQPTHRPEETWETNAVGTRRFLAAAVRAEVPVVIVVSSVAAYSPADHDDPVDEGWDTDGASPAAYCREKAYVERTLDAFEAEHPEIRLVRLRPAFVFQRSAASEQRRIFGGSLLRPMMTERRRIPVLPVPAGLRFQAVHAGDVARAVAAAVATPVSGAFNLAAEEVMERQALGHLMGARTVEVPAALVRATVESAWHARLATVPGSLLDAVLHLPLMATDRARAELAWAPRHTASDALEAVLSGAPERAGSDLPPLRP